MKKNITFLLVCLSSFVVFSQDKVKGNGVNTMIETKIDDFKKIILNNDFEVTLIKSESSRIEIETDENLHEEIEISVNDSILTLETSVKLRPKNKLDVTIFCSHNLDEIELNDDSKITSLRTVDVDDLLLIINDKSKASLTVKSNYFKLINKNEAKMQLKSNSLIDIESKVIDLNLAESANSLITLKTDSLHINLKKHAFLELNGDARLAVIHTQNNTDLKAKDFNVKEIELTTKDNAKTEVNAIEKITIEAFDKSATELYGDPEITLKKFRNTSKLYKKEIKRKK